MCSSPFDQLLVSDPSFDSRSLVKCQSSKFPEPLFLPRYWPIQPWDLDIFLSVTNAYFLIFTRHPPSYSSIAALSHLSHLTLPSRLRPDHSRTTPVPTLTFPRIIGVVRMPGRSPPLFHCYPPVVHPCSSWSSYQSRSYSVYNPRSVPSRIIFSDQASNNSSNHLRE